MIRIKGRPSLRHQSTPIHGTPGFPTFRFKEREWGPPRRTPGCMPPHFSCICHVGFDFGFWPLALDIQSRMPLQHRCIASLASHRNLEKRLRSYNSLLHSVRVVQGADGNGLVLSPPLNYKYKYNYVESESETENKIIAV